MMVDAIETYYKDRITMLKERISTERYERKIAQQAQQDVSITHAHSPHTGTEQNEARIKRSKETRDQKVSRIIEVGG